MRLAARGGPPYPRHMTRPIEARQGNCPPEKIERVSTKPPRSILHSTGLRESAEDGQPRQSSPIIPMRRYLDAS